MFEKISHFRTELMGFAIIWVILYHSGIGIPILDNLYRIGYGGVDIFFFLSGLGLYFSFKKEQNLALFYKKRFIRVFPTYTVIVLFSMILLDSFKLTQFLVNISMIGYWINRSYFEWYIPSLILFYLLFPLLFKLVNRDILSFLSIVVFVTLALIFIRINLDLNRMLMLFITRIPIFALGTLCGKWTFEKRQFNNLTTRLIILSSLVGLISAVLLINYLPHSILWNYGLFWHPFILITPGLCALISFTLDALRLSVINKVLAFFGTFSLELYLLHIKLFEKSNLIADYFNTSRFIVLLIIFILIIPSSIILSMLISFLNNIINNFRLR
jgi:peptidoglycan/LPS O-acetylase OafA/YrhL